MRGFFKGLTPTLTMVRFSCEMRWCERRCVSYVCMMHITWLCVRVWTKRAHTHTLVRAHTRTHASTQTDHSTRLLPQTVPSAVVYLGLYEASRDALAVRMDAPEYAPLIAGESDGSSLARIVVCVCV